MKLGVSQEVHIPIPFPRLTLVQRECLTPNRSIRIRFVPPEDDDDGFSVMNILCVKPSDVSVE